MRNTFARKLTELANVDKDIILITGDLGFSVFDEFKERFPEQFLNIGLCEQSMIGISAGMALEGKKVFVYSIIPFLIYRTLEQIRNDLCYQEVPVKLIGVGSGFAYGAEGGTHHAIEDLGIMTSLPNMMVFSPGDPLEVEKIVENSLFFNQPCYIRLNKNGDPIINTKETIKFFEIGKPLMIKGQNGKITIFSTGNTLSLGLEVFEELSNKNIKSCLYSFHTLKPIFSSYIKDIIKESEIIVTIEEHFERNGIGYLISQQIVENQLTQKILNFNLTDNIKHMVGSQNFLRESYKITKSNIIKSIFRII